MNEMVPWKCEAVFPPGELTVGDKFQMVCRGQNVDWTTSPIKFKFTEQQKNSLKIIDIKAVNQDSIHFIATAYAPGKTTFKDFFLSDGKNDVKLESFTIDVVSVLPKNLMIPPEPYGDAKPVSMSMPIWIWGFLAILVAAVIALFIRIYRNIQKKKKFQEQLQEYSTPLSPYHQFYKDTRKVSRSFSEMFRVVTPASEGQSKTKSAKHISELELAMRLYLLRELQLPTLDCSRKKIEGVVKSKKTRLFKVVGPELRGILLEINRAESVSEKLTLEDAEQLVTNCQNLADRIWKETRRAR